MRVLPAFPVSSSPLGRRALISLTAALGLAAVPQLVHLPLWAQIFIVLCAAWRVLVAWRAWPPPQRWLCLVLAGIGLGAVYLHYGTLLGRDAGSALLSVMVALKLLETKTQRDGTLLVLLGYFLVISGFLYSQSLLAGLYMLFAVLALTSAWINLNHVTARPPPGPSVRLAGVLLMQALPFMVLLFVLFPRVSGSLWGLQHEGGARSGLSDEMTPGSIGALAQSDAVAFRATFTGSSPPPAQRYWRGPVLWLSDGRSWTPGVAAPSNAPLQLKVFGQALDYRVSLEAHQRHWLFALEMPVSVPDLGRISGDFQLLSTTPILTRTHYQVRSYPHYQTGRAAPQELQRALQLPRSANPRSAALGRAWRAQSPDSAAVVQRALHYFRSEPFFYTLNPPLLGITADDHPVDEFLFETRRGFCEHYAGAFVTLMRAAGVPARVVTGYQGGELNPFGNYLIVRQSDAHAWAEVWLEARGWVRIDPTAAVAPQRVERGGALLSELDAAASPFLSAADGLLGRAWLQARLGWDGLNYQWGQWVLGYNPARQGQLLAGLGLDQYAQGATALGLILVVGVALLFSLSALGLLITRRTPKDAALALYLRFCAKLAQRGIRRAASEGPHDFGARAAARLPRQAQQIRRISELYSQLRYGAHHSRAGLARLQACVRAFRI